MLYVLEPKLRKPGLKILEWDPIIKIGINMDFSMVYLTQVWLVLKLLNGKMPMQCHILFYDFFNNVASITSLDPEVGIRLVVFMNSRIQIMLDQ